MALRKAELVVADDDLTIRKLLSYHGERAGFEVVAVEDGLQAMEVISAQTDVVLLDLNMPGKDGFECLEELAKKFPKTPAVMLTADREAEDVVRAMKLGAIDYITKPFDPDELIAVLLKARRLRRAEQENEELRETIGGGGQKVEMVAVSPEMEEIVSQVDRVAGLSSTILITGESGVGKGVLARYIHAVSDRAERPFVTVSCPALPRELLESELFGHEKGAFTGAIKRRIGKIEAAKGGTLFLDEIGDLPLDLQPKLLSVLQDREFQRIGGSEVITADVRIIAATNIDFEQHVASGEFREDLFYRLSVIPFDLPPLRERKGEVASLVDALLLKIGERQGRAVRCSAETMKILESYDWPGNIRQLENVLERSAAFCGEAEIGVADLPKQITSEPQGEVSIKGLGGISLAQLEKAAILQTLELCKGNKAETARRLGVTEKSVYNKMKRLGIS